MKNLIFISLIALLSCQDNQAVEGEKIITDNLVETFVEEEVESDSAFIEKNLKHKASNQKDAEGYRQGFWIVYGQDWPEKKYPADGKIEEGMYRDDKKIGEWIYHNPDGTTQSRSHYTDDLLDGKSLVYDYEKGVVTETNYEMGKVLNTTSRPIDE